MYWYFFKVTSVLEILLISTALYYWLRLLAQDRQKPLMLWFLSYLACACFIFHIHLPVISHLLLYTAPAVLLFFMLIHQDTLQKNLIRLCNITPVQPASHDWLTDIVRLCMISIADKKNIYLIIEKTDSLSTLVECSLLLHAPINRSLITLLYSSTMVPANTIWWANRHGKLLGINALVKDTQNDWLADVLLLSSKTDALFISVDATTRLFTLIAHAKMLETEQATHILTAARQYLALPTTSEKKEPWYDTSAHVNQQSQQQT